MNNFPQRDYGRLGAQQLVRQTSLAVANAQSLPGECFVFGTGDNGQLGAWARRVSPRDRDCSTPSRASTPHP